VEKQLYFMTELSLKMIVKLCTQAITKDVWKLDSKCTSNFESAFSKFAEKLGYRAQYKPNEFHTIDMVWWSNGRMVAAIEHENKPTTVPDPIDDEWKKLTYIDADYKILISYCTEMHKRKEWLKRASETIAKNPREKDAHYYLVLGDETFWGFRGYEFDNSGKLKNEVNSD